MAKRAAENVRYLAQFGEHVLTRSFTAPDPERPLARGMSEREADRFLAGSRQLIFDPEIFDPENDCHRQARQGSRCRSRYEGHCSRVSDLAQQRRVFPHLP